MSPDLAGLQRALPLATASSGGRVRIRLGDVTAGGPDPVVIAGPCAVESLEQLLTTARRVKAAGAHGLRGGAYKPRSSPYSFQGLGRDGLEILAAAKVETGLFLTVEVITPEDVGLVADYADLLQIGARNMQNYSLLRAAGRCDRPVLLKRGLSATIQEWLQAAEYILSGGNTRVILCERGIRTFEIMTRNTFDLAAIPLVRELTGLPVFADPSHATGRRSLVAPVSRAALAAGADGLLVEVHPDPARALSDGDQSLSLEEFSVFMAGLAIARPYLSPRAASPYPPHPAEDAWRRRAGEGFRYVPLHRRIAADELTPVGAYRRLVGTDPGFLLESVEPGGGGVGRYSFVGDRPLLILRARGDRLETTTRDGAVSTACGDVLAALGNALRELGVAPAEGLPRFYGGAVGYLGYDYVSQLEPVAAGAPDPLDPPTACWLVPERLVIFDHVTRETTVVALASTAEGGYAEAAALIDQTAALLQAPAPVAREAPALCGGEPETSLTEEEFRAAVIRAKEQIAAGEAFQIVLSLRLTVPYHGDPLALYRALRAENPSPYLYLLQTADCQLVGSSPETLVRLVDGAAELRPIAGTRARGAEVPADQALEAELRQDPKECAEHVMLVDLGRNDLGRVCRYGTVRVPEFMAVERYSRVMHLVSRVTGELAPGHDAVSLLRAVFPAGTLSGAPKVRAMQIIAELEPHGRGVYGGAVGYLGFNDNMDVCIAIRTALLKDGTAAVQAGAGIVADSDPAREYAEARQKAAAVLSALRRAKEGEA
ncbi:MAG: 3-deoxy-7-phosphoheptulonate synthase [Bacteroidota bacterium]